MAKEVGTFVDLGDDKELPHPLRSRPDNRTNLEYFIQTGKLPWSQANCDLCLNQGKQEVCDKCTGIDCKFISISIEEAKEKQKTLTK